MAKKVSKKDFDLSDFDLSGLGGDSGYDTGMGDPGAYGGNDLPDIGPIDPNAPLPIGDNPYGTLGPGINPIDTPGGGLYGGTPGLTLGGGSAGGSSASTLARLLGLSGGGSSGGLSLASLLPFLGAIGGGILNHNATQQATQQTLDQINKTNGQITGLLGNSGAAYQPYMQAGQSALAKLQAMPASNIASQFAPIGSGKGLSLASIAKGR